MGISTNTPLSKLNADVELQLRLASAPIGGLMRRTPPCRMGLSADAVPHDPQIPVRELSKSSWMDGIVQLVTLASTLQVGWSGSTQTAPAHMSPIGHFAAWLVAVGSHRTAQLPSSCGL